jgi:hypothetical protein
VAVSQRDRLAGRLCNVILNTLATPWYRNMIRGSILYGLDAAARDDRLVGVVVPHTDEAPEAPFGNDAIGS